MEEERANWRKDSTSYLAFRKKLEPELQAVHVVTLRGSDDYNKARRDFTELMHTRLAKKPETADHLLPNFPPLCKRFNPGPGYLEALTADNVTVIPKTLSKITPTGILGKDKIHRPVDAIVCATGFHTSFQNRFSISGIHSISLSTK